MCTIICALYAGIARNVKGQRLLWDLYAGIAINAKMPVAIFGLICRYCILENGLMEFIIENDGGIICLKCVDYF